MSSKTVLQLLRDLAVRIDASMDPTLLDLVLRDLVDGLGLEGAALFTGLEDGALFPLATTTPTLGTRGQELSLQAAERGEVCLRDGNSAALCLRTSGGEFVGALWIASTAEPLSDEQCTAAEVVACLLGGALSQARLTQQALWTSAWLARLNDLSQGLSYQRDLSSLVCTATEGLSGLVEVQETALYLIEDGRPQLTARSLEESELPDRIRVVGSLGQALLDDPEGAEVALGRGNLDDRPLLVQLLNQSGDDAAYGLVLFARSATSAPFSADDEFALSALTSHLSIAVRNVRLMAEIRRQATYDHLTGLAGRRHFLVQLQREIQRAERDDRPLSVLMIDADHFKRLNDCYGHAAGDHVLVTLARRLEASVRAVDLVGRLGGEEMGVVLPGAGEAISLRVAERLRMAIDGESIPWRDLQIDLTVSIGVACWRSGRNAGDLLEEADRALYGAKAGGRDQVVTASSLDEMESVRETTIQQPAP